jgi:hypothetical protein
MIVGFSGFSQVGKDTAASALDGFERIALADKIREAIYKLDPIVPATRDFRRLSELVDGQGWDRVKVRYPEVRRLLQVYGTECGRDLFGENVWLDAALKHVNPDENFVVTDVRFQNEVDYIRNLGGTLIKIVRPGVGPRNAHSSEAGLPDSTFDFVLTNNGSPEDLQDMVRELVARVAPAVV